MSELGEILTAEQKNDKAYLADLFDISPEQIEKAVAAENARRNPQANQADLGVFGSKASDQEQEAEADEAEDEVVEGEEGDSPDAQNAEAEHADNAPEKSDTEEKASEPSDELDGLTLDNARERIKNAHRRVTQATQNEAKWRKMAEANPSDNNAIAELKREVGALRSQLESPGQKSEAQQAETEDKLGKAIDALEAQLGEYGGPIVNALRQVQEEITGTKQNLGKLGSDYGKTSQQIADEQHTRAVLSEHPDAFEIGNSEEFKGWFYSMPREQVDLGLKGAPEHMIHYLNVYKSLTGIGKKGKATSKAGSAPKNNASQKKAPPPAPDVSRSPSQGKGSPNPKEWTRADFLANEDAIMNAHFSGRG